MADEKINTMEKVSIRILRAFYRNGELLKVKSVVDGVPRYEAAGYKANRKAEIVEPKKPITPDHSAQKSGPDDSKKKEEKKS